MTDIQKVDDIHMGYNIFDKERYKTALKPYTDEDFEEHFGTVPTQEQKDHFNTVEGRLEAFLTRKWMIENPWSQGLAALNFIDPISGPEFEYHIDQGYINLLKHLENHNRGVILYPREGMHPSFEIVSLADPRMANYSVPDKPRVRNALFGNDFWTAWYGDNMDYYWAEKRRQRDRAYELAKEERYQKYGPDTQPANISSGQSGTTVRDNIQIGGYSSGTFDFTPMGGKNFH